MGVLKVSRGSSRPGGIPPPCDILMLRICCTMRHSHVANSQNENSHNETTSQYRIYLILIHFLVMGFISFSYIVS